MKKNIVILFISFVLFFISSLLASAAFSDVPPEHVNSDAIQYVQEKKIVNGYPDGTFKPDQAINRAELTKIIVEAALSYSPEKDSTGYDIYSLAGVPFSDVEQGAWYIPYLRKAVEKNIINGYPDGTFKPAQNISFVEAAKIIVIGFGHEVTEDEIWYKPFVEFLENKEAVPASIDTLTKNITRGEMAEIIYRLKKVEAKKAEYVDYSEELYQSLLGNDAFALFFHAEWCPLCRNLEKEIVPNINDFPDGTKILKVNYDEATTLRQEYKITVQASFVIINAQGEVTDTLLYGPKVEAAKKAIQESLSQ